MAVRTAYAGAAVAGEVLTAANVNRVPGGWIGYNEVTASQGSIGATEVALTTLTVTVTVGTSRRIRISAETMFATTVAQDVAELRIKEGTTVLQARPRKIMAASQSETISASVVLTPSAGSHTYYLAAILASGSGTITSAASATQPASILVEDIGPAS